MRPEKQLLVDEIQEQMANHHGFLIMRYEKLKANAAADFRRQITELGGDVEVVRKRLLLRAAQAMNVELDLEALPGHISLVFSGEDPIPAAKAVFRLQKESKTVEVIGGRIDGKFYPADDIEKLSKLPGINDMRAQILGILEAPMGQTLAVMDALLCSVIHCLDNKRSQEN
ncbi:MAG: 50S ribosomal protein L10 [Waddliaceae bacterium]